MEQVAGTESVGFFFHLVEVLLVPILWKVYSALSDMSDKIDAVDGKVNMVQTILIGPDGKNGIRSRVRRLEKKVERIALFQAANTGTVVHSESDDDDGDE
jgi:hypothetical protein